jgi:hypothetical protein
VQDKRHIVISEVALINSYVFPRIIDGLHKPVYERPVNIFSGDSICDWLKLQPFVVRISGIDVDEDLIAFIGIEQVAPFSQRDGY